MGDVNITGGLFGGCGNNGFIWIILLFLLILAFGGAGVC